MRVNLGQCRCHHRPVSTRQDHIRQNWKRRSIHGHFCPESILNDKILSPLRDSLSLDALDMNISLMDLLFVGPLAARMT